MPQREHPPEIVEVARRMFRAYARDSDGLTYDRKVIPPWEKLTAAVQHHWCCAADEAVRYTKEIIEAELQRRPPPAKEPCPDCSKTTRGVVVNPHADVAAGVETYADRKLVDDDVRLTAENRREPTDDEVRATFVREPTVAELRALEAAVNPRAPLADAEPDPTYTPQTGHPLDPSQR
jgi:hypothetical protein